MRPTTSTALMLALLGGVTLAPIACSDPVGPDTDDQLATVRDATEAFASLDAALAAGYVDINVVMQNMGHHYLKADLLDGEFELERPEILVYAPDAGGTMRLVAVEYAVPLDLAVNAPAGFKGNDDVWDRNETFQLWTLHAWVHLENPDGVFAPFNPMVVLPSGEAAATGTPTDDASLSASGRSRQNHVSFRHSVAVGGE